MSDTTPATTQDPHNAMALFTQRMSFLSAGIRRASQNAESAILRAAQKKWRRDKYDHACRFPEPITEDTHHEELKTALEALSAEINNVITESHAFD